ncbi:MAG: hypothetical protein ACFFD1_01075, partial [Candidatus Thorarchaeota archaeon]
LDQDAGLIPALVERGQPVEMRCIYSARGGGRCQGSRVFEVADLAGYMALAGNGPHSYGLRHYPRLQYRCPECGHFQAGDEIITGNLAYLRELAG